MNYNLARTALILVALVCFVGGCSPFDHDWDAAATLKPESSTDITGRWQGTWASDAGHSGDLRCLMTKVSDTSYHARYAATYGGIFHFNYEMDLSASLIQDWVHFQGSADLGSLAGGMYKCEGDANSEKLFANYHSDSDHGQFNLKRP